MIKGSKVKTHGISRDIELNNRTATVDYLTETTDDVKIILDVPYLGKSKYWVERNQLTELDRTEVERVFNNVEIKSKKIERDDVIDIIKSIIIESTPGDHYRKFYINKQLVAEGDDLDPSIFELMADTLGIKITYRDIESYEQIKRFNILASTQAIQIDMNLDYKLSDIKKLNVEELKDFVNKDVIKILTKAILKESKITIKAF